MTIKTYRGNSPSDALAQVKRDLGPEAVILHTRTQRVGGMLGMGARTITEITATRDSSGVRPRRRARAPEGDGTSARAQAGLDRVELSGSRASVDVSVETVTPPAPPSEPRIVEPPRPGPPPISGVASALDAIDSGSLAQEMAVLKRMVGQMMRRSKEHSTGALPAALEQCYLQLIEAEVATEIADEIVGAVREELGPSELRNGDVVRRSVLKRLAAFIQVDPEAPSPERGEAGRPRTIALIGPTGVGKTTTVAKLAATYKLRHGKRVGLVTSDTYRIAAVDQLRTYANIIGLPLEVALTPNEMARACRTLSDCDVILIDSAGRSQNDATRIEELRAYVGAASPDEVHLVMSCAASESVLRRTAQVFSTLEPSHVIFTKLDEAVNFGMLINVARGIDASLSFVTTGQEVPDQIEHGSADRLARLVLEGGGVR